MRLAVANRFSISFGWDTWVTVLVCVVWAVTLVGYAKGIINRLPFFGDIAEATQASLIVIPLVLALPALVNRFCLVDYLFYFAWVFYYLFSYAAYPENSASLTEFAFQCLCCVFPFYFIGRLVDIDRMFNLFVYLSSVCIVMDLLYHGIYAPGEKFVGATDSHQDMYRAYLSLPHVAMLLWATLRQFRVWKLVLTFLGVLFLLSLGTRGPLACLGFFGFIYFLFFMNFRGAIYVKGAIVAVCLLVVAFLRDIALFLAQTFLGLNLSTRILEKVIAGDLGNDTLRSALREILYRTLDDSGNFFGLGIFGSLTRINFYPHFLPLDLAATFGYVFGYAFLALLLGLVALAFLKAHSQMTREFLLLLFSVGIVKLMFSNTFLLEPFFFMLIGVCVCVLMNSRLKTACHE